MISSHHTGALPGALVITVRTNHLCVLSISRQSRIKCWRHEGRSQESVVGRETDIDTSLSGVDLTMKHSGVQWHAKPLATVNLIWAALACAKFAPMTRGEVPLPTARQLEFLELETIQFMHLYVACCPPAP